MNMKPMTSGVPSTYGAKGDSRNSAMIRVGRLLEVRVAAGYRSGADVDALFEELAQAVSTLEPGVPHVTVADWRRCTIMSPESAKRIVECMASINPRTERSATIAANDSPTAVLQFVRVMRDSGHPDRKLFTDKDELAAWLSEVLTPAEAERLREFLTE